MFDWDIPEEDEETDKDNDREPRKPIKPNKTGGAEAPLIWQYEDEEELVVTLR